LAVPKPLARLDETHKLLDEIANMLTEMRRTMIGVR
jgi:hypothetical protein